MFKEHIILYVSNIGLGLTFLLELQTSGSLQKLIIGISYLNCHRVLHLGKKPEVLDREAPPMNYVLLSLSK